jgi:dsRNA-specific ribonuclease
LLADKSLADVVEALIGCFLLRTGQQNTLAVMARMGIDLTPANTLVSFAIT